MECSKYAIWFVNTRHIVIYKTELDSFLRGPQRQTVLKDGSNNDRVSTHKLIAIILKLRPRVVLHSSLGNWLLRLRAHTQLFC